MGRSLRELPGQGSLILCGGGLGEGTVPLPGLEFCLGGSCLLALALLPVTSVSPYMTLVPFQLLPWY